MLRSRECQQGDLPQNAAELLLLVGRKVRKAIRRGAGIQQASRQLQSTPDACLLALAFVSSSDLMKLRALVEDWSPKQIAQELSHGQQVGPPRVVAGVQLR